MERINKHNYEAFFLDFIEGNLSAEEQHDLFVFLAENPELKEAFEGDFSEVVLTPSNLSFDNKEKLKVFDENSITLNNVEHWMIASVEGELNTEKEKELQDFIKKHQLQKTFTTYHATKLKPNLNEVYPEKRRLKVGTGIVVPLYARVASIAAVGIILISVAMNYFDSQIEPVNGTPNNNRSFAMTGRSAVSPLHPQVKMNDTVEGNDSNLADSNSKVNNKKVNSKKLFGEKEPQNDLFAVEKNQFEKDSVLLPELPLNNDGNIVNNQSKDTVNFIKEETVEGDIALANSTRNNGAIKTEQPYKLITDAASNVTKREIYYSRDKNMASNEYVAYQFKLGNFEFERKKTK